MRFHCCTRPPSAGFLALMIVLWLLILRALAIELRMQVELNVWRTFFDGLFFLSSLLPAVFSALRSRMSFEACRWPRMVIFFFRSGQTGAPDPIREFSTGTRSWAAYLLWPRLGTAQQ